MAWPALGTGVYWAPGMRDARLRAISGRQKGSCSPAMTRTGQRISWTRERLMSPPEERMALEASAHDWVMPRAAASPYCFLSHLHQPRYGFMGLSTRLSM